MSDSTRPGPGQSSWGVHEGDASRSATWNGQSVCEASESMGALVEQLPRFDSGAFGLNRFMRVVYRMPWGEDAREIPVAAVSKKYKIVQHDELVGSLSGGLQEAGYDPFKVKAHAVMSEYGERLHVRFSIPEVVFDPGDGHPVQLTVEAVNSMDRSHALEVWTAWLRTVCHNSLLVGGWRLRKIHHSDWFSQEDVGKFLTKAIHSAPDSATLLRKLLDHAVEPDGLKDWLDDHVAIRWGVERAVRLWSILKTGEDGSPDPKDRLKPPSQRRAVRLRPVPGAEAHASNMYHCAQALSWIAGTELSIGKRLEMYRDVKFLLEDLAKLHKVRIKWSFSDFRVE